MLTLILIVLLVMTMSFFKLTISPLYISYITIGTLIIATVLTAHNIIFVASTLSNIQVINCLIYIASVAWLVNTKMYASYKNTLVLLFSITVVTQITFQDLTETITITNDLITFISTSSLEVYDITVACIMLVLLWWVPLSIITYYLLIKAIDYLRNYYNIKVILGTFVLLNIFMIYVSKYS